MANMFSKNLLEAASNWNLSFLDVGARGGIVPDLLPLAAAVDAICFEPEPEEASKLENTDMGSWRSLTVLPTALGGSDGTATLYVPESEESASLLQHNSEMVGRFGYEAMHKADRTFQVTCKTLDTLKAEGQIFRPTYLKLDIEGAELEVLKSATTVLDSVVAMRLEVSFLEQRLSQPLIWEVVEWLRTQDYEVIDVIDMQRWRRRVLPAAPYRYRGYMPYSKGRVSQCDLLLSRKITAETTTEQKIQAVLITSALGYFDSAIQILRDDEDLPALWIGKHGFDLEDALNCESRRRGRLETRRYLRGQLRDLVPAIRSVLVGISAPEQGPPY